MLNLKQKALWSLEQVELAMTSEVCQLPQKLALAAGVTETLSTLETDQA